MTDDKAYLNAVAETLERLQIEPQDLLGYVLWLRTRYSTCVQTLHEIWVLSEDSMAACAAKECLEDCGVDVETYGKDVSHETN